MRGNVAPSPGRRLSALAFAVAASLLALGACGRTPFPDAQDAGRRDGGDSIDGGPLTGERMRAQCNAACDGCGDAARCRYQCLNTFLVSSPSCQLEALAVYDCGRADGGRCAGDVEKACPAQYAAMTRCWSTVARCNGFSGGGGTCDRVSTCTPRAYESQCTLTNAETSCECLVNGQSLGSCTVSASCPTCVALSDRCTEAMVSCCFGVFYP